MNFSILASLMLAAVSPAFVNHNSMKGSVRVMTNQVEWAAKVEDAVAEKRYALFIIPATAEFPDFELKASTNNFTHSDFNSRAVFYCSSTLNDGGISGATGDSMRLYVCYTRLAPNGDGRRWTRIKNTVDHGLADVDLAPSAFAVIIDPALLGGSFGSDWLSDANDELVWSYVRISDADGPELEADGQPSRWRWFPTMPVRWYSKLPAWANQEPYSN